jgi:hypothetical protein
MPVCCICSYRSRATAKRLVDIELCASIPVSQLHMQGVITGVLLIIYVCTYPAGAQAQGMASQAISSTCCYSSSSRHPCSPAQQVPVTAPATASIRMML